MNKRRGKSQHTGDWKGTICLDPPCLPTIISFFFLLLLNIIIYQFVFFSEHKQSHMCVPSTLAVHPWCIHICVLCRCRSLSLLYGLDSFLSPFDGCILVDDTVPPSRPPISLGLGINTPPPLLLPATTAPPPLLLLLLLLPPPLLASSLTIVFISSCSGPSSRSSINSNSSAKKMKCLKQEFRCDMAPVCVCMFVSDGTMM